MQNDADLLDAWRSGDMASGSELFRRHVAVVSRFFANKVGDEREDLIQRTFLACVESRDRIRDGSTFGAYVLRVARSKLQDHYRAQRKDFDTLATSVAHLGETPSQMLFRGERDRLLAAALRSVPLDLQITLELYYWERMSINELAEVLGIAAGTVKSRLHEARQRVRDELCALVGGAKIKAALPSVEDLDEWIGSMRTRIDHMASGG